MEILISDDNNDYESIAKIYDFTESVRIEISTKCRYMKFCILDKDYGKAASIDFLRVYGH
jgi:hypothetical protein